MRLEGGLRGELVVGRYFFLGKGKVFLSSPSSEIYKTRQMKEIKFKNGNENLKMIKDK